MAAVEFDGLALQFVRKKTPQICAAAIAQNPKAAMFAVA